METKRLVVDIRRCDAYGYCAELLPEIVELDEWGYPIVTGEVTAELLAGAERAAAECPRLALRVAQATKPRGRRIALTGAR